MRRTVVVMWRRRTVATVHPPTKWVLRQASRSSMTVPEIIGLVVLGFAMGAQIRLRSFWFSHRKQIFWTTAAFIFASLLLITIYQYIVWRHDPVSKFLLPPYQGIYYFLQYAATRFFGPWLTAAAIGLVAWYVTRRMNARFDDRFFEDDEPCIFGFAVFLAGYPACLFFIVFMFIAGLLWSLGYAILGKGRASFYYLWFPTAMFAILYVHFLLDHAYINIFKF